MWSVLWFLALVNFAFGGLGDAFVNIGGIVCPREEKALGRCLRDVLNKYIPFLGSGMEELGVPPCDPLYVPALSMQHVMGPFAVSAAYSDVVIRGASAMRITDLQIDSRSHIMKAKISIPELSMSGRYQSSGQLMKRPTEGSGQFIADFDNVEALVTIKLGRVRRRNDEDALGCDDLNIKFRIGHASFELEDPVRGDPELGYTVNQYLNENWQKLTEDLKGPMERALYNFLKPLADHSFGMINASDVLS